MRKWLDSRTSRPVARMGKACGVLLGAVADGCVGVGRDGLGGIGEMFAVMACIP